MIDKFQQIDSFAKLVYYKQRVSITELLNKVIISIRKIKDCDSNTVELALLTSSHEVFVFLHEQDCCEYVYLYDVDVPLETLLGAPITTAYESSNEGDSIDGHATWTFYTLGTMANTCVMRWLGESNGYYSESVSLYRFSDL